VVEKQKLTNPLFARAYLRNLVQYYGFANPGFGRTWPKKELSMTKRTLQRVALALLASPLLVVGCGGDDNNNGGTGGSGGGGGVLKYDAAPGTGGTISDAAMPPDLAPPALDVGPGPDITMVEDAPLGPDLAPSIDVQPVIDVTLGPDAPVVDTRPPAMDVQASEAQPVDIGNAVEAPPALTCTETTKFSGGTVNADRVLTKACSPYTIKTDVDVGGNATLTIEAGVTVKFNPDTNISVGYSTAAKLVAVGTAADPIVLTSANSTPGAGDWAGVQLWGNVMNGTSLAYVKFDYCGSAGDACLLGTGGVKPNRVTVDHLSFAHVGDGSDAILERDRDSNFAISNCTFSDIPSTPTQQYAISVYAPSFAGIDANNTFNGQAMVQLMGGTIATNTTWKNVGTTVAVTEDLSVQGTATPILTVSAGSAFKFASGLTIDVGYSDPGSLVLAGTATSRITLGSLAGAPAPGDWVGIILWSGGGAKIAYSTISYAGSDRGAISVDSNTSTLDIQNSTIDHSASYGIGVRCNSTATVTNTGNTFTANASGDVGPGPIGIDC
jgi:hypothetical protein